mmetsp:Transcript_12709/g.16108  ORF Transcript_12709/g.16108 Transcript_12709/m.16108 type:complete len:132 (-) Transcript_12709:206-601(-)
MDTNVRPDEIPDGFTAADPTQANAGPDSKQAQKQAQQEQKRSILEQSLTPEALARLGTIKLVKPEKVTAVENMIISMAVSGKLPGRINEGKLIEMLEGIGAKQNQAKSINIQRKKYAFDSDDDDDNDDDLL